MRPTSSRNTPEGDLIFSSRLAAFTASRAAERMAEITPERPARMPAFRPAMAFTPTGRSVEAFRLPDTALLTLAATLLTVSAMG